MMYYTIHYGSTHYNVTSIIVQLALQFAISGVGCHPTSHVTRDRRPGMKSTEKVRFLRLKREIHKLGVWKALL